MEEFLLRLLLALQELDIVDNQAVNITVLLAEGLSRLILDRIDDFVRELFTGGVEHLHAGVVLLDAVADSVHQVSFAQTNTAVQEERVVGMRRIVGYSLSGSVRKAVGVADNEGFKYVLGIQVAFVRLVIGAFFIK